MFSPCNVCCCCFTYCATRFGNEATAQQKKSEVFVKKSKCVDFCRRFSLPSFLIHKGMSVMALSNIINQCSNFPFGRQHIIGNQRSLVVHKKLSCILINNRFYFYWRNTMYLLVHHVEKNNQCIISSTGTEMQESCDMSGHRQSGKKGIFHFFKTVAPFTTATTRLDLLKVRGSSPVWSKEVRSDVLNRTLRFGSRNWSVRQ